MLRDLETELMNKGGDDKVEQSKIFYAFLGSSPIWQPQKQNPKTNQNSPMKI